MTLRGAIVAGVTAAAMLAAGGVLASALNDLPQDAVPIQDPTAALNRQTTPPTPSTSPPVEPAPEAAPAPSSPVAVTPAVPTIVIAEADEKAEEKQAEAAPAKRVEAPAAPARRQRRRVAIVEAIDKITAESMRFEVEVGGRPVRFQRTLIFTARACEVSAPDEQVSDAVAYLEVSLQPRGVIQVNEPRQIFRGWMFASSPAISGLEHPIYDAWIVGCKA
ncbi:MAG: DUF2155 domain-containing protein [Alphaproteobacteria bacterium]|uniref:DUF2155 domain-containing protein n=1 Tax=Brevundimonas sp. TaxID=1871086 RepID=UPI0018267A42|nr:DUF2155 domain-containing protein [Brevundimonas sp.]MBA3049068.1 DUF2155 domain-containing protein [Brevundimonas sp.]MBU3974485.1 DUF2155 domain-containing protein [Alphaproteobacteria bacterium]MBU4039390.1 DUF2155 domain-containing protein [Alphaproteobacteria bacterium]MBU4135156.1 DUF2155 domain-containing protein [Alphaproteobacteria bacterium]